ncbi:MAG: nickel pincer cofactor-dependent isomerase, group 22 [Chloroflexota bacterium]
MSDYPRFPIPDVALVRRHFTKEHIEDVAGEVRKELARVGLAGRVKPGQRIALTAGSRGVTNIAVILGTIAEELKKLDAKPFIVPTMGSHGGATAEGQVELIAEYGVTEEALGVPILSSMETVILGETPYGAKVHMDKNAFDADGVIVVGRIKNHTSFRAPIESGLCKMMAIGLGKQKGAESVHDHGLPRNIPEAAKIFLSTGKILLGVGTIENAYHQTHTIVAAPPEKIMETDMEYLKVANKMLPRVPFDHADVIVVDWIGKNISGTGMDMNVMGMWRRTGDAPYPPIYKRIVVLNVRPESHGNCAGLGAADFTTRKLVNQWDAEKTYWNMITGNFPEGAKIPFTLDDDVEAVGVALRSAKPEGGVFELVRIKDTMNLDEFYCTAGLLEELKGDPEYEVVKPLGPMPRDAEGNLLW